MYVLEMQYLRPRDQFVFSSQSHRRHRVLEPRADGKFNVGNMVERSRHFQSWTNSSVLALARDSDPVQVLTAKVRDLIFHAFESGWSGPPYDPFALAAMWGVEVTPSKDVVDAQILTRKGGALRIEFNPDRPTGRINYSVAHELGHSLFPDCADIVRHRIKHSGATRDEWQLEMLCNIAAAEILMPVGTLRREDLEPEVDLLLDLRKRYAVSSEAVLLRMLRLTPKNCLGFVARREPDSSTGHYKIDYAVGSSSWQSPIHGGWSVPQNSVVSQCTAIGFTAKAAERWFEPTREWRVEAVGIPPYPGRTYPRVVGIVRPVDTAETPKQEITYLKGDATVPRGSGIRILAHIVSDRGMVWGAGFGRAVRKKWPKVQDEFAKWVVGHHDDFRLGSIHISRVDDSLAVAHLVAQHGVGPSRMPRVRYGALEKCLQKLADCVLTTGASVHMPRIGTGEAGGSWEIVGEIVEDTLCQRRVDVTVYDLPTSTGRRQATQPTLSFPKGA
jgi:O-acetyl-ADP-ribose deacetylase (regulator of RNase III)